MTARGKRMEVTILGCGTSGGVPRVGNDWGACDPNDPRNVRTRCSLLVRLFREGESDPTTVLIDTSPDCRAQLLRAQVKRIDALLYTHEHADQAHGIDDVRAIVYQQRRRIPTYMDEPTRAVLRARFRYCFESDAVSGYPAILEDAGVLVAGRTLDIDGPGGTLRFLTLLQDHGGRPSLGFRFGGPEQMCFGYSNDCVAMDDETLNQLRGLDTWIVDAMRYDPHPTHAHLARTLEWHSAINPGRTILTNLHVDMDYTELSSRIPDTVEPAIDGMTTLYNFP
jgi:phosphoribosyl 1,2-cyclic phosphate phosphodiesterase